LGVTDSYEKAIALKQSYVDGYEIYPTNIYIHYSDCPAEADRWGAITMSIPIGSQEYVKRILDDSELSPIVLLNMDFDSLVILADREPQLAFLFLCVVFAGRLTHFLRGLLPVDSRKLAEVFAIRQREVLQVMLDVSDISDEYYSLATLGLQQGGTGPCHSLDIVPAYPDIKDILADGQCSLPYGS